MTLANRKSSGDDMASAHVVPGVSVNRRSFLMNTAVSVASIASASAVSSPSIAAVAGVDCLCSGVEALRAACDNLAMLRVEHLKANDEYNRTEELALASLPERPDYSDGMPPAVMEAFKTLTVGQINVIDENHPYMVWEREKGAAREAEQAAYAKLRAKAYKRHGVFAAEALDKAISNKFYDAYREAMAIEATGIEAIALKLYAIRLVNFDDNFDDDISGLIATIDASAPLVGFKTAA
jgi:hypothetical protein